MTGPQRPNHENILTKQQPTTWLKTIKKNFRKCSWRIVDVSRKPWNTSRKPDSKHIFVECPKPKKSFSLNKIANAKSWMCRIKVTHMFFFCIMWRPNPVAITSLLTPCSNQPTNQPTNCTSFSLRSRAGVAMAKAMPFSKAWASRDQNCQHIRPVGPY